ncbi:Hypothetical protein FKW44_006553, partial [Caligus rogercresseyi]
PLNLLSGFATEDVDLIGLFGAWHYRPRRLDWKHLYGLQGHCFDCDIVVEGPEIISIG